MDGRQFDQFGPDSVAPSTCRDDHVLQPGVHRAVPYNVEEPYERRAIVSCDPSEAMPLKKRGPVICEQFMLECLRMQLIECGVVDLASPHVCDIHHRDTVDQRSVSGGRFGSKLEALSPRHEACSFSLDGGFLLLTGARSERQSTSLVPER